MTKEEALKLMQAIKSYMTSGNPMWSVEPIGEAMDMAIEALEQSQWIPISKEPDTASHVLVTAKWGEDDYEVFETDYWVVKHGANDPTWKYQAENKRELDHITAWQHMPEPWKGEDE